MIIEPAPAKINLALHIRRKRPDGYHDLETLFAFAHHGDVVTMAPAKQDGFTITGPFAAGLRPKVDPAASSASTKQGANLVTRARDAFRSTFFCPPVAIALEKNLPIASGIGGGSADAAATLRALAKLQEIDPADPSLVAIARALGADVPACLLGRTAFATGKGDDLTPLPPLGDVPLLLINPGVPLSTAAMFADWDGIDRGSLPTEGSALDRARAGRNDFTAPAIRHAAAVGDVLDLLAQAAGNVFVRLSGSGATCFGIFEDASSRDAAAIDAHARKWWALATSVV